MPGRGAPGRNAPSERELPHVSPGQDPALVGVLQLLPLAPQGGSERLVDVLEHAGERGRALALGSLDGLNLTAEIGNSLIRNYYTGRAQFAMSHVLGGIDVPLTRGVSATLDVGYGVDLWVFTTLGLKQRISGDGGPGTLVLGAGIGLVWVVDRFPCQYGDIDPCRGAAWGSGPTIAFSVDRRF